MPKANQFISSTLIITILFFIIFPKAFMFLLGMTVLIIVIPIMAILLFLFFKFSNLKKEVNKGFQSSTNEKHAKNTKTQNNYSNYKPKTGTTINSTDYKVIDD